MRKSWITLLACLNDSTQEFGFGSVMCLLDLKLSVATSFVCWGCPTNFRISMKIRSSSVVTEFSNKGVLAAGWLQDSLGSDMQCWNQVHGTLSLFLIAISALWMACRRIVFRLFVVPPHLFETYQHCPFRVSLGTSFSYGDPILNRLAGQRWSMSPVVSWRRSVIDVS